MTKPLKLRYYTCLCLQASIFIRVLILKQYIYPRIQLLSQPSTLICSMRILLFPQKKISELTKLN